MREKLKRPILKAALALATVVLSACAALDSIKPATRPQPPPGEPAAAQPYLATIAVEAMGYASQSI